MSGELAFFEIGVRDAERGRAFYEGLFGWTFEPGPSGKGFLISAPNARGGMHGGDASASPYLFFRVDDLEEALARVRELGGEVAEMEIEGDEEAQAKFGRSSSVTTIRGRPSAFTSRLGRPSPRSGHVRLTTGPSTGNGLQRP